MDQLRASNATLAKIAFGAVRPANPEVRTLAAQIEMRRDQLEASLSRRREGFESAVPPVTLEAVQAAVPGDAALLEFTVFRPFDPEAERNEDAYGPPHYAAYVVLKSGAPRGIDLGVVEQIDPLIVALRRSLRDPNDTEVRARARALDEKVVRPLRSFLGGATRLLISPDGGLNLVPFEALVDEHGHYLIERYATTYLTSGRDLLRMHVADPSTRKPVIVADPLFGEPASTAGHTPGTQDSHSATADAELYFAPLLGSALEARAIKNLFPDATLLTGRHATKATLEQVDAPSILHIASHGFFLDDTFNVAPASVLARNPLLRSGLALAGANLPGEAHGDGILTALEASSLNLRGTALVTLSACDTGIGDVRNGEGAYGLRRGFMLAGAETLVMSLWPVTDAVARDTMVGYYTRLRAGFGRGDALRQAKLGMLRHTAMRHPCYWGGFIQSGDWTRLRTNP
jgi:CHAT domain-containing protein